MMASVFNVKAQWLTSGNALGGAGLLGSTNKTEYSFISNNTQRIRITSGANIQLGSQAVLNSTPINYGQFDDDGDLRFFGTASYLVPSNAYAFRWEGDEDIGLFFNASLARYEFRDNAANAIFHVTSAGDVHTSGDLSLGGTLRMDTGTHIQMGTAGITEARLHIQEGTDASLASGGIIVLGSELSSNVAFDVDEVMARYNHTPATLYLSREGGEVRISGYQDPWPAFHVPWLTTEDPGQVGIRWSTPSREMELVHQSGSGASYGLMIANEGPSNQDWTLYTVNNDGNLAFYQNGLFAGEFSDGDGVYSPSDERLKANIKNMEGVLERIIKLEPKTFNYIHSENPEKTHIGFIAQEIEKQFPEIVGRAGENQDTYVMNYSLLNVVAVKAIQERQQMIEDQQGEIDALKDEMKALMGLYGQDETVDHK
jgi:hypothetical protein